MDGVIEVAKRLRAEYGEYASREALRLAGAARRQGAQAKADRLVLAAIRLCRRS